MKEADTETDHSMNGGNGNTRKQEEATVDKIKKRKGHDVPEQPLAHMNDGEYQRR